MPSRLPYPTDPARNRVTPRFAAFLPALALVLAACASDPPLLGRKDLLDFLADGRTPAAEVYLQLGPPAARFEDGRIATWRLDKDTAGYLVVASHSGWHGVRYELVVVFSPERVVERHSLIEVRSP